MLNLFVIRFILRDIWADRAKTLLSINGIILGVFALIVVMSVLRGVEEQWNTWFRANGGVLYLSVRETPIDPSGYDANIPQVVTDKDAEFLRQKLPNLVSFSVRFHRMTVSFLGKSVTRFGVCTDPGFLECTTFKIAKGRFFTELECATEQNVVVLGDGVARAIFPQNVDPVGRLVAVNDTVFRVIGVLSPFEGTMWDSSFNQDNDAIIVPSHAFRFLTSENRADMLMVKAPSYQEIVSTKDKVESALRMRRNGVGNFLVQDRLYVLREFENNILMMRVSAVFIGVITLLVGGMGIMNVVLGSIRERVCEIAIKKAIGASNGSIFFEVLFASLIMALIGGGFGTVFGVAVANQLPNWSDLFPNASVSVGSLVVALAFSFCVGIFSGVYPATLAARLSPLSAFRSFDS